MNRFDTVYSAEEEGILLNRVVSNGLWIALGVTLVFALPQFASISEASDWQVRRTNRLQLMARNLRFMLHKKPFSGKIFRKLVILYRTVPSRERLRNAYSLMIRRSPHKLSYQIILARLLRYEKMYLRAILLFEKIQQKRPGWKPLLLQKALCLLEAGKKKQALKLFIKMLPTAKGKARRRMVRKILSMTLEAGETPGIQFALKHTKNAKWSRYQTLRIAQELAGYKLTSQALHFYEKAAVQMRGSSKVKLLLEMSQVALTGKAYSRALLYTKQARGTKRKRSWQLWDILDQEVQIVRAAKRLPRYVVQLTKRWKDAKKGKKLLLLARLWHEVGKTEIGIKYDLRTVAVHPSAWEARVRLIKWHKSKKEMQKAYTHMEQLVKHRVAAPKHYLDLAEHWLKRSQHPSFPLWSPSWAKSKKKDALPQKQSEKAWKKFTKQKRKLWKKNTAPENKKRFANAIKVLYQCSRHHASQWDALVQIEALLTRHGQKSYAKRVRKTMAKTAYVDWEKVAFLRKRYQELGQPKAFRRILKKALRRRSSQLDKAVELSYYALQWSFQDLHRPKQPKSQTPKRIKRRICPSIYRFLRKTQKRHPDRGLSLKTDVRVQMAYILGTCRKLKGRTSDYLKSYERANISKTYLIAYLFKHYSLLHYDKGIKRLLGQLFLLTPNPWKSQVITLLASTLQKIVYKHKHQREEQRLAVLKPQRRMVFALLSMLRTAPWASHVFSRIIVKISAKNPKLVPILLQSFKKSKDKHFKRVLASLFPRIVRDGRSARVVLLRAYLNENNYKLRAEIVNALNFVQLGGKEVDFLLQALKSNSWLTTLRAKKGLQNLKLDRKSAFPVFVKCLGNKFWPIKMMATRMLSDFDIEDYPVATSQIPFLLQALKSPPPLLRKLLVKLFVKLGKKIVPALVTAIRSPRSGYHIRENAVIFLGHLKKDAIDAVPLLVKLVCEKASTISIEASDSLAKIGPPAIPELIEALKLPNPVAQISVSITLGKMRKRGIKAVPALNKLYNQSKNKHVKMAALWALAYIHQFGYKGKKPMRTKVWTMFMLLDKKKAGSKKNGNR